MRLLQDVVEPPPQVNLLLASEIIFFITAVTVRAANSGRSAGRNCDRVAGGSHAAVPVRACRSWWESSLTSFVWAGRDSGRCHA